MSWYVLFVKTGYEHKTVGDINRGWKVDGLRPFVPMYDARFKQAGRIIQEKRRLLPGYVFVEMDIDEIDFYIMTYPLILRTEHAYKVLRYNAKHRDSTDYSFKIKEEEQQVLLKLYNDAYCVEMSQGFIEGDRIIITEGSLIGLESYIKKINRHKMEALIELELMGDIRELTVGLEIVSKI